MALIAVLEGLRIEPFRRKSLKHLKYRDRFSPHELELLETEGHVFQALMDRVAFPISPKHKHFVQMCNDLTILPSDPSETVWKTYLAIIEEDRVLEEAFRSRLIESSHHDGHAERFYFGGSDVPDAPQLDATVAQTNGTDDMKQCPICKGRAMKYNGDNCDACNGWGWKKRSHYD
jgi:uncharacterized protein YifE (UPF0438 family)